MKTIVAIGGGETFDENISINKRIVELSKKKKPRLLFIPTASGDSIEYFDKLNEHFSKLNCICDALYLIRKKQTKKIISEKILNSDIIYVGGGNTFKMMKIWKRNGVDKLLKKAYENGTVMCGLSAGSICWFKYGNSDSRKINNPNASLIKVTGLGLVNALHCPHYDIEKERKLDLKSMMKKTFGVVSIAIDNCCAIEIVNDEYKIINSKKTAMAYKVYWKQGKFIEEKIEKTKNYKKLNELISKKSRK